MIRPSIFDQTPAGMMLRSRLRCRAFGVVPRVDSAFADAWKNIDDGFSGFATSLKDGFKQLLAELAHMAITKPIIMQIGASLGGGTVCSVIRIVRRIKWRRLQPGHPVQYWQGYLQRCDVWFW